MFKLDFIAISAEARGFAVSQRLHVRLTDTSHSHNKT